MNVTGHKKMLDHIRSQRNRIDVQDHEIKIYKNDRKEFNRFTAISWLTMILIQIAVLMLAGG